MATVDYVSHEALRPLVCITDCFGSILLYGKKDHNATCNCIHLVRKKQLTLFLMLNFHSNNLMIKASKYIIMVMIIHTSYK